MTSVEIRRKAAEIMHRFPELSGVKIRVSERMTSTAGQAELLRNKITGECVPLCIKLSAPIFRNPVNEAGLEDVVLHEIAHLLTPGHDHDFTWYLKARAIGCTGERTHSLKTPKSRRSRTMAVVCTLCGKRLEMGVVRYRRMIRGERVYYHSSDSGKLVCEMAYDSQKVGEK